jgi:hypothetical protein
MKYETPELVALTPAINAIQGPGTPTSKTKPDEPDSPVSTKEAIGAYTDWE